MCLQTTWTKPKIAEKDIICYKLLRPGINENEYLAPFKHFKYISNRLYKTRMTKGDVELGAFDIRASSSKRKMLNKGYPLISIVKGFHSAMNKTRLRGNSQYGKIVKCIIPKGAKYYKGLTNLLVSDKIIITNEIVK